MATLVQDAAASNNPADEAVGNGVECDLDDVQADGEQPSSAKKKRRRKKKTNKGMSSQVPGGGEWKKGNTFSY